MISTEPDSALPHDQADIPIIDEDFPSLGNTSSPPTSTPANAPVARYPTRNRKMPERYTK